MIFYQITGISKGCPLITHVETPDWMWDQKPCILRSLMNVTKVLYTNVSDAVTVIMTVVERRHIYIYMYKVWLGAKRAPSKVHRCRTISWM